MQVKNADDVLGITRSETQNITVTKNVLGLGIGNVGRWFGGAAGDDVFCPWAFFALDDIKADCVAFLKVLEAIAGNA